MKIKNVGLLTLLFVSLHTISVRADVDPKQADEKDSDCQVQVLLVAKAHANMYAQSKAKSFTGDVVDKSLELKEETSDGHKIYSVGAEMGRRGSFLVLVTVDNECARANVEISD